MESVRKLWVLVAAATAAGLAIPASTFGHAERPSYFPDPSTGGVPNAQTSGTENRFVVCKRNSGRLIRRYERGRIERRNLRLLRRCRFRNIQTAINRADNDDRIQILPGRYRENPSRRVPDDPPECEGLKEEPAESGGLGLDAGGGEKVPSYEYHRRCPNAKNLITIAGDSEDGDRKCDDKCNLRIAGMGARPSEVRITGCRRDPNSGLCDHRKLNTIRVDRADGTWLRNFRIQYSDFNNVYFHETNGFRISRVISRWSREYGILSFTSENGLYEEVETYGNGDSGVYPGAGPEGRCERYGIEIRNSYSHDNVIGSSGTAGNGTYFNGNRFENNAAGVTTDSFAPGHPGMPQDCSKWENNDIGSNNQNFFTSDRDEYCKKPADERDPRVVCPAFQVPVGTGLLIGGGNGNIVANNRIYDNWRIGVMLFWVPAAARGEPEPEKQHDTSYANRFENNVMGGRPQQGGGFSPDPNGLDFWWDEETGRPPDELNPPAGNCWTGNFAPPGAPPVASDFGATPTCLALFFPGNSAKQSFQVDCAAWDPQSNPDPPSCRTEGSEPGHNNGGWRRHWFETPPEP
jgi:Right handed beta helix region